MGREAAIDFTHCEELSVTVGGKAFPHLLFELVLSYSKWLWAQVAFGETFEALVAGVQGALWDLGAVPEVLRSDNLSAATHELKHSGGRPNLPLVVLARSITYRKKGFPKRTLLTSMGDVERFPAAGIVELYHERWEIEMGYDEIKTHMLDRQEAIRSRTPTGVRQELWGIVLAYNLVRLEMERAADEAKVEPTRISFVNALAAVRYCWLISTTRPLAPGKIPQRLLALRRQLKLLVLPPRRPERRAPRVVKIKMSKFKRKRPTHGGRK